MTLKELRQQNKKTVAEVAEVLGVALITWYGYEQGTRRINIEQIVPLAELFDISERELIEAQLNSCQKAQSDNPK